MGRFGFGPAFTDEQNVHGARRPGYNSECVPASDVQKWIDFMKSRGIKRVCCLLSPDQLAFYDESLLEEYRQTFGEAHVCWAPVEDYHLIAPEALNRTVLPFLSESAAKGEPVVVHCSGGSGRTGHVLAAWLAFDRGLAAEDALSAVRTMGRNPWEAVQLRNATLQDLHKLLDQCRRCSAT